MSRAIILPIKTIYADKIYSGEKRFEYRKRLCNGEVSYIYLYEVSPVKKITGYVENKGRLCEAFSEMWKKTGEYAGVDYSLLEKYFAECYMANAYVLGKAYRFNDPRSLAYYGIKYIPQSFTYIEFKD